MFLGKIAGVSLRINLLFLVSCVIYGCLGLLYEVILITSAVLLHEIAHTAVALLNGVKVSEIELYPFGGQARIDDFTGLNPHKEIRIAVAGPITSLFLAVAFFFAQGRILDQTYNYFININLLLGLFNLLPALPLDGGRILRATLARRMGFKKATQRAALAGKLCAAAIFLYGGYLTITDFSGANLLLIGIFVFWGASREGKLLGYSFMRFLVHKKNELSRYGFLPAQNIVSQPGTKVIKILNAVKPEYYVVVTVVDSQHNIVGMAGEAQLIEILWEIGPEAIIDNCISD